MPGGKPVCYQKHMTHHMLPAFGREWLAQVRNAFLIRDPAAVLASYVAKRGEVTLADIGIVQQRELFEREADRLGRAPPVVEGTDVLADPARVLAKLCAALGIAYDRCDAQLARRAARHRRRMGAGLVRRGRAIDRLRTAGGRDAVTLGSELQQIADAARPHYEALARHKLRLVVPLLQSFGVDRLARLRPARTRR